MKWRLFLFYITPISDIIWGYNMEKIEYKVIEKYPDYGITKNGEVISLLTGIFLKQIIRENGYKSVALRNGTTNTYIRTHLLVAEAYIPNPDKKKHINHKDGDKLNNNVDNLEWTTIRDNTIHAYETGLISTNIFVTVENIETKEIKEFRSIGSLSEYFNTNERAIIGYIKFSDRYPYKEKYIIRIKDESRLINNKNSLGFGREVYVYDLIYKTKTRYDSLGLAMYHTGIRNITQISERSLNAMGFILDYKEFKIIPLYKHSHESMLHNRKSYYSNRYKEREFKIAMLDPLSENKEVSYFKDRSGFFKYLLEKHNINITPMYFNALRSLRNNHSKLLHGYLIQTYNKESDIKEWGEYTLEELYNSRKSLRVIKPVYLVKIDNSEQIIYGMFNLLRILEYYLKDDSLFNRPIGKLTILDIHKCLKPNSKISIKRLNKIKIKI